MGNNPRGSKGVKNITIAIGEAKAKLLVCVERDQPTEDGGKAGEITSNPRDIDAVVKRAWQRIHNWVTQCIPRSDIS